MFNTKDGTQFTLNRAARRVAEKTGAKVKNITLTPVRKATDGNHYRNGEAYPLRDMKKVKRAAEVVRAPSVQPSQVDVSKPGGFLSKLRARLTGRSGSEKS